MLRAMKISRILVVCSKFLLTLLLLTGSLLIGRFAAAEDSGADVSGGTPVEVKSTDPELDQAIENFQNHVQMRTLPNGLRVLFYKRGIAPVFSGAVVVRVGGSDELPGHTGIAHMFEHMAFKGTSTIGTSNYPREKVLLAELEKIAAATDGATQLSGDQKQRWNEITAELKTLWEPDAFTREYEKRGASGMNATTSTELTSYFVSLPSVSFEFWAAMEAARLGDNVMRQFYQERDVVLEERRMRYDDSGDGRLYEQLLQSAFTTHPYRYPVIGYPQDISKVTASGTVDFRKRFYVPENIVVSVVGNLDADVVFSTVERYFGRLASGKVRRNVIPVEPPQTIPRSAVVHFPAEPQTYIGYHKPSYPHPDAIPILVANQILTGGPTSILYKDLVEGQRILSSIEATEAPGSAYPNLWVLAFAPRSPHSNSEGICALKKVLSKITLGDISAQIEPARRALLVGEMTKLKSDISVALDLASTELLNGSWRASIEQLAELKKVTAQNVMDVIKRYLVDSNETVVTLERATVLPIETSDLKITKGASR